MVGLHWRPLKKEDTNMGILKPEVALKFPAVARWEGVLFNGNPVNPSKNVRSGPGPQVSAGVTLFEGVLAAHIMRDDPLLRIKMLLDLHTMPPQQKSGIMVFALACAARVFAEVPKDDRDNVIEQLAKMFNDIKGRVGPNNLEGLDGCDGDCNNCSKMGGGDDNE